MLGQSARTATLAAILALLAASGQESGVRGQDSGVGGQELGYRQPLPLGLPTQGLVLLRNGQVIEGKITKVGELFYVALPHGEIQLRAADVECCCRDLDEGYRRKRSGIRPGNVRDHLELARWCLQHGLLGPAGRELADAVDADPTHPMIGVLERRLKIAPEPPKSMAPSARPLPLGPAIEDLDRLVRGMPAGTVETFTQTIQPVLVNHCTSAGCHGPSSTSDFRLERTPVGRPPSRQVTWRNLHAALQWIDREEPTASRLLTAPAQPHGTAKKPVFTPHQVAQYKWMVDWVCQVAQRPAPKVSATVAPCQEPPVRAMPAEPPVLPATHEEPVPPSAQQPPPRDSSRTKRGAAPAEYVPVDPFDPEIFNRRYFPGAR